jgi:release factor glutamine methyltransferase
MIIRDVLRSAGIPRLDAEVLLAHVLGRPRSFILAHDGETLSSSDARMFQHLSLRRAKGEPIAYILKEREFFGRPFFVTPEVLIPRPATEGLVELTLEFLKNPKSMKKTLDTDIVGLAHVLRSGDWNTIVDVGTGSGCIAITLALEGRHERMIAVDVSERALRVAKENAKRHNVEHIECIQADGPTFVSMLKEPFVIVSNPPYIPEETMLDSTVSVYEPHAALFAGPKGFDIIRPLATAARNNSACRGMVLELREDQSRFVEQEWTMNNG